MERTVRIRSAGSTLIRRPLAGLVLWLLFLPALAGQVDELYQAAVPVADQGVEARSRATGDALERVLVKLTGDRRIAGRAGVTALLKQAPRLVQQYRYETPPGGTGPAAGRRLWVQFDARAVNQALRERGLPVWGVSRPSLLLWLGVEEGGLRRFSSAEVDPGLEPALEGTAGGRGMSLVFPLLDLEDRSRVRASDLWGGFDTRLRSASQRYGADVILVGRLERRGPDAWRADWRMLDGDRTEAWQTRGAGGDAAAAAGLEEALDRLADRYAPIGGEQTEAGLVVSVDAVGDLDGFLRVDGHLKSLDVVDRAVLLLVAQQRLLYRVQARGGIDALMRSAPLGGLLIPEPRRAVAGAAGVDPVPDLSFRLSR